MLLSHFESLALFLKFYDPLSEPIVFSLKLALRNGALVDLGFKLLVRVLVILLLLTRLL